MKKENITKEELTSLLLNLPELIRKKEVDVLEYSKRISTAEEEIERMEGLEMIKVSAEKEQVFVSVSDPHVEKKKFKNEISRKAEVYKRLHLDKEYLNQKKNYEHSKKQEVLGTIRLKYLFNQFSATKYLVRLMTQGADE